MSLNKLRQSPLQIYIYLFFIIYIYIQPTPVSALIHAATLVTAGLYLLVRSSPILEYSSTALLVITLVGATTAFFAATCGLVQNDIKRIIAFSTISQLGYSLRISYFLAAGTLVYFLYYDYLFNQFIIDLDFNILMLCNLPLSISQIKDKFLHYIKDKDCFTDFSSKGKSIIKTKYFKKQGIYLWVNNTNNKSYVGKSVNLYQRLSKYLSKTYIQKTKNKMGICSAIDKYGTDNFTLYILETITVLSTDKPSLAAEGGAAPINYL